ncbi:MAG: hypothetical protein AAFV19_03515 [Pseudomonadota bacterium]
MQTALTCRSSVVPMLRRSIRIADIQQLEPGLDPTQQISINYSQVCTKLDFSGCAGDVIDQLSRQARMAQVEYVFLQA